MTVKEVYDDTLNTLRAKLPEGETLWTARILTEDVLGTTRTEMLVHPDREVLPESVDHMHTCLRRIMSGEPVQYVVGYQMFMGMKLAVNPDVLIPRPETASLVDAIVDRCGDAADLRVLDVGTGSGCIALALARRLRFPDVTAVDISGAALQTAKKNAASLGIRNVSFKEMDALAPWPFADNSFDIIVSNPPYVLDSERPELDKRVSEYEPSIALFVPDSDPLKFYHAIAREGVRVLRCGGYLYFEGNPLTLSQLFDEMQNNPEWENVELWRDDESRLRFLKSQKTKN